MYAKKLPRLLLRICIYRQIIWHWKTLFSKITIRNFCVCMQKNFHISIKDLRICANNSVLEDFVNRISAHVHKNTSTSLLFAYMRKKNNNDYYYKAQIIQQWMFCPGCFSPYTKTPCMFMINIPVKTLIFWNHIFFLQRFSSIFELTTLLGFSLTIRLLIEEIVAIHAVITISQLSMFETSQQ